MNPISDITEAVSMLIKLHRLDQWSKLAFQLILSAVVSFLVVGGLALGAGAAKKLPASICWVIGAGSGSVAAGVFITKTFRASPLTKGMMLIIPAVEASEELKQDDQTIERSK